MMEYSVRIESEDLIGKTIKVYLENREMQGIITDIILAGIKPTKEQMKSMYSEDWENKACKSAQKPLKVDRIKFIDEFTNHPIVLPLNSHSSGFSFMIN